jgi:REP element-mobilizing transposase RayT
VKRDVGRPPQGEPLAYFLTWTTYGTWLPGDERGWVAKPGEFRSPDLRLQQASMSRMTEPALLLDGRQRLLVESTIADHCRMRGWHLHTVACRTNHVHVVVTASGRHPEDVMNQLKAWCTRRLKEHNRGRTLGSQKVRSNWWTQRGSKRWLNEQVSLEEAIVYVHEGQKRPRSSS